MSTANTLGFLDNTLHGLTMLTERVSAVRFDLVGSVPSKEPAQPPGAPTPSFDPTSASYETGVEYYANRINTLMNTLDNEIQILRGNVNHKKDAVSLDGTASKAPY